MAVRAAAVLTVLGALAWAALASATTYPTPLGHGWWLWPSPPPGPLVVVAEWPAHGVADSRATVAADLIEDARSRIPEVWPSGPAGSGYTVRRIVGSAPYRAARGRPRPLVPTVPRRPTAP